MMEHPFIDLFFLPNFLNKEFLQTLNPLYLFPIISVIGCVFIIYAFGLKASVQPPSFKEITDEKRTSKKRKSKDTNKKDQGKVLHNEKVTGSDANIPHSDKKKVKKVISDDVESAPASKKGAKKMKLKKDMSEKSEIVLKEETYEDGWVQLTSKKGRKSQKKNGAKCVEELTFYPNPVKNQDNLDDAASLNKELPKLQNEKAVNLKCKEKEALPKEKDESNKVKEVIQTEKIEKSETLKSISDDTKSKISENQDFVIEKQSKKSSSNPIKNNSETVKVIDSLTTTITVLNDESKPLSNSNLPSLDKQPLVTVSNKNKDVLIEQTVSSNVVFDELAGLYPEAKEQRKKKKVRRDH